MTAICLGTEPNAFLRAQQSRLKPGWRALAVADGEGRNGVWLAQQGLDVLSVDGSSVAQDKARKLATARGVQLAIEHADLDTWAWPVGQMDVVVGIFIQFVGPSGRDKQFANMKRALKPGGMILLEGYRPEQLRYGTGGPTKHIENLYTGDLLRAAFADMEILSLTSYDAEISEGTRHQGMSALIDLVARKAR